MGEDVVGLIEQRQVAATSVHHFWCRNWSVSATNGVVVASSVNAGYVSGIVSHGRP